MQGLSRRRLLEGGLAAWVSGSVLGCARSCPIPNCPASKKIVTAAPRSVVDIHAHTFNATDLPVARFLRRVVLSLYARPGEVPKLRGIEDPDAIDALIRFFLYIVDSKRAPTARDEIAVLSGKARPLLKYADESIIDTETIDAVAEYLRDDSYKSLLDTRQRDAERALRDEILREGGETRKLDDLIRGPREDVGKVAARAYLSPSAWGRAFRWFSLFRQYRYSLVDRLAANQTCQGFNPIFIAPALVDYSRWLQESPDSSQRDQVTVMGLISARPHGPVVHAYAAFDPLHAIMYRKATDEERARLRLEPVLKIVEDALDHHGFLGVKLYPPMGFRPTGNVEETTFPQHVIDAVGPTLKEDLDEALDELYETCRERDAPIIAHGTNSNQSGEDFGDRADPAYWLHVFRKRPDLRVCLAHFGSFKDKSAAWQGDPKHPDDKWEWTLGNYILQFRNENNGKEAPVYADLSYFSEILHEDVAFREPYARDLRLFISTFDPECRHLLFGSDWIMLGIEKHHESYTTLLVRFLKSECGLDDVQVNRILYENAYRFAGLEAGGMTRTRLQRFYRDRGLSPDRLPVF